MERRGMDQERLLVITKVYTFSYIYRTLIDKQPIYNFRPKYLSANLSIFPISTISSRKISHSFSLPKKRAHQSGSAPDPERLRVRTWRRGIHLWQVQGAWVHQDGGDLLPHLLYKGGVPLPHARRVLQGRVGLKVCCMQVCIYILKECSYRFINAEYCETHMTLYVYCK